MEPEGRAQRSDLAGMRAFAEELQGRFEKLATEGPQLQERARAIQVTEKSSDGLIAATVGARGELIRLDLDPRIYRRPDSRELADTITETIKAAGAKAQEEVLEVFEPLVPREEMQLHMDGNIEGVLERMADQMHGKG
ncbi:MAG: YbaB/EbfC family nucleoid-associated protein [Actinomycetota bacterium]|nr:YbaB/EbfC family nucleoid-associated protein [Actinomycetota bacterium]